MKRTLLTLAVCGFLAAAASPAEAQLATPLDEQATRLGGAKEIALAYRTDGPAPVKMPRPDDPLEGPAAFAGDAATLGRGAAIPNSGGGSFVSPKQQADKNIRQLIRKLG